MSENRRSRDEKWCGLGQRGKDLGTKDEIDGSTPGPAQPTLINMNEIAGKVQSSLSCCI
jgi:hypothetical protein